MSQPRRRPAVIRRRTRGDAAASARESVPEATVARLPLYLRVLTALAESGVHTVSSDTLATAAGVNSAKVRKDLSYLGTYGTRGVGYEVDVLLDCIAARLGLTEDRSVVLVGVGNLGHALAGYGGFHARGFRIVALVDADPNRVGERVGDVIVRPVDELEQVIAECAVTIGVICTPAAAAQLVCERLVAAGVTSILNFAPTVLSVPEGVDVRKVDLAVELQILSFHEARKRPAQPPESEPARAVPAERGGSDGVAPRGSWPARAMPVRASSPVGRAPRRPAPGPAAAPASDAGPVPPLPATDRPPGVLGPDGSGTPGAQERATGTRPAEARGSAEARGPGGVAGAVLRSDRVRTETDGVKRVTRQAGQTRPAPAVRQVGPGMTGGEIV
ncbi:Redox-sensing transcriptional repressor Rex [Frankia canadensis]|uniref:Redox-sensing transcriptional repressor Rex n=1 Tax=Frankia canadensis TaxID=1836972 RepID=A0A2I2KWK4_9ACTN|nr:redox-sensing transcriptional repressor Rex [Frankia canadensis]SNQ50063.1 Redox-sensing transcriptional repressor Rex [Frankia canadensis]SOU57353.1 Redox-sensing transcriptional repressor Rex [Frankia canadensis]